VYNKAKIMITLHILSKMNSILHLSLTKIFRTLLIGNIRIGKFMKRFVAEKLLKLMDDRTPFNRVLFTVSKRDHVNAGSRVL